MLKIVKSQPSGAILGYRLPEDTWMLTHTLSAAVRVSPLSVSAPSRLTDSLFCCIGTNFAGQIGDDRPLSSSRVTSTSVDHPLCFGDNLQHECWVAIRGQSKEAGLLRYAAALFMCATHFHFRAPWGPPVFCLPFPPRGQLLECSASNLPFGFAKSLHFYKKLTPVSVSRTRANIVNRFSLAAALFPLPSQKEYSVFKNSLLGCGHFPFITVSLWSWSLFSNHGCHCVFGKQSNEVK